MSVKTRTQLKSQNDTEITQNPDRLVTGQILHDNLEDVIDSAVLQDEKYADVTSATFPIASDDSYAIGQKWIDTTTDVVYVCVDNTASTAIWNAMMSSNILISDADEDTFITTDLSGTDSDTLIAQANQTGSDKLMGWRDGSGNEYIQFLADGTIKSIDTVNPANSSCSVKGSHITFTAQVAQGSRINADKSSYIDLPTTNGIDYFKIKTNHVDQLGFVSALDVHNDFTIRENSFSIGTALIGNLLTFNEYTGTRNSVPARTINLGAQTLDIGAWNPIDTNIYAQAGRAVNNPAYKGGDINILPGAKGHSGATDGDVFIVSTHGNTGFRTLTPQEIIDVSGSVRATDLFRMQGSTSGSIAAMTPIAGDISYNTTSNKHMGYDGTIWNNLY